MPGDKPHYPRDRVADIKHVRLDFTLDLIAARIDGSVAHTFTPINDGLSGIDLDAVGLEIKRVSLGGERELGFDLSGGRLHIDLGSPQRAGDEVTVVVDFGGSPKRGLYFIQPDHGYPEQALRGVDSGRGRRLASLVPLLRLAQRAVDQRDARYGG